MEPAERAILETRCFSDVDADIDLSTLPEEEKEELGAELAKLEDEIATLRQVLIAKEKHLAEIKQKMGITPLNEIKHNFSKSWHDMQTSVIYKKTQETLNNTGQKASAALTNVSSTLSKKLGEMNLYYFSLLLPNSSFLGDTAHFWWKTTRRKFPFHFSEFRWWFRNIARERTAKKTVTAQVWAQR
uniref:tumor protein D53 isoform X3 n=1 Tax=Pristiophorus japonicus TaxID=55135 RepID=UPI00398E6F4C